MKKRIYAAILCGALALGLVSGCGKADSSEKAKDGKETVSAEKEAGKGTAGEAGKEAGGEAGKNAGGEAGKNAGGEAGKKSGSGEAIVIAEGVQRAIDAADRLTTGGYLIFEDGSVATRDESEDNFAGDYAALPNLKKIADSSSEMQLFALTEEGDLYFHQTKILSGVKDVIYSTTNMNETAVCIAGDKIYKLIVSDPSSVVSSLREASPDTYFDVEDKVVRYYEVTHAFCDLTQAEGTPIKGEPVRLDVEKSDFFVLNSQGKVFMDNNGGSSEEYIGLEFFSWDNMAVIDAEKRMVSKAGDSERKTELTVAGIRADGTVKACGAYAEDILSWGKLNYISMDTGLIVGLSEDGTLKAAGPVAEYVQEDLAGWTNLAGVKVGNKGGTTVVNAVSQDGTYYHLEFDARWTGNAVAVVSTETCGNDEHTWYRYDADGTITCSDGENGSWIPCTN